MRSLSSLAMRLFSHTGPYREQSNVEEDHEAGDACDADQYQIVQPSGKAAFGWRCVTFFLRNYRVLHHRTGHADTLTAVRPPAVTSAPLSNPTLWQLQHSS